MISSSPEFPSICDLVPKATKKPPLRTGSNAAPVPEHAPTAFTSAASIWQSSVAPQPMDLRETDGIQPQLVANVKLSAVSIELSPEPAVGDAIPGLEAGSGKPEAAGTTRRKGKSGQPALESVTDAPASGLPTKKPGRKPRSTKDTAAAQTKLAKGKVTKPATNETHCKKTETVSKHFAPQVLAPVPPPKCVRDSREDQPVILEPAMKRRLDWTPPRESAPTHCLADTPTMNELSPSLRSAQGDVFRTLLNTYGRAADTEPVVNSVLPLANPDVLGKRKLFEMVAGAGNKQDTPEVSPAKPKAVKKKPRTITELATAAYRLPEMGHASTDESKQDASPGYLDITSALAEPSNKAPGKGKRSKPTKPKPKATKKNGQVSKQLLLSPTSAMRQVAKQDFVFGTASQLAIEDDPDLLRALHEAMKASNQPSSDPFVSPSTVNSSLAIRKRQGPSLWAAGARYAEGELLDVEVLDLTRSSPLSLAQLPPEAPNATQEAAAQGPRREKAWIEDTMFNDTVDLSTSPPIAHPGRLAPHVPSLATQAIQLADSSPCIDDRPQTPAHEPDFEPPPSNQEQHQLLLSQSNSPRRERPAVPPRPEFELYTDARLAKEVASYGFKAMKKRTAMVALLNQCWESRNSRDLGSRVAQAAISTSSTNQAVSPSRVKGRPRKTSVIPVSETAESLAPSKHGRNESFPVSDAEIEPPQVAKRPRGRPRKNSVTSTTDIPEALAPTGPRRRRSVSVSDIGSEPPQTKKQPRGRPRKDALAPPTKSSKETAPASPKRARARAKPAAPAPETPRRRKANAAPKSTIEIPDSDSDDPFVSSPASSPGTQVDLFSSPPAVDLSVTEDTESSLISSPTTQEVALFRYITQAVISAPRATDPANPSWHEKMLMYDPIILEDLTAWLNAGQLDRVGYDGEVPPGIVKKWCESKSVCCLWKVSLRGGARKRL